MSDRKAEAWLGVLLVLVLVDVVLVMLCALELVTGDVVGML